jgi:hypothetical protein
MGGATHLPFVHPRWEARHSLVLKLTFPERVEGRGWSSCESFAEAIFLLVMQRHGEVQKRGREEGVARREKVSQGREAWRNGETCGPT